jgi:cell wall assembly regulator SMI1
MTGTARQADEAWTRIEAWLARYAPDVRAALRPPAGRAALDRVARIAGTDPPADLAAWWNRSHGLSAPTAGGSLFPDRYHPLPLDDSLGHRARLLDTMRRTCPDGMAEQLDAFLDRCAREPAGTLHPHAATLLWLPSWLPVAHDAGGGGLFADLRPGPARGCLVRYTRHGQATAPDWPGLAVLLTHVADSLEEAAEESGAEAAGATLGRWTLPGRPGGV